MFLDQLSCICKRIINVFEVSLICRQLYARHILGQQLSSDCVSQRFGASVSRKLCLSNTGNCNYGEYPGAVFPPVLLKMSYLQVISKVIQGTLIFKIIKLR